MKGSEIESTARALVAAGKGILAADESTGTIEKRFKNVGIANNEENRQAYRELLFTAPGIEEFISGVILYDETIRQHVRDGRLMPEALAEGGIFPGIKVDKGAKNLALYPGEKITEGLDGLRERLAEYRKLGARFTKWRAVIAIGAGIPTRACMIANAQALARFAALSQEARLVPIVEPEVLTDGDHPIERCEEATAAMLGEVFQALAVARVALEGMLLKPNMVIAGELSPKSVGPDEVAEATLRCLRRRVPAAVPGIVFLSGGQNEIQATENLNTMNRLGSVPWELSFSYGRALQASALNAWRGAAENVVAAQKAFYHRARMNSLARDGKYRREMEKEAA
jgi:fructose-bisphosphate aldolase class I